MKNVEDFYKSFLSDLKLTPVQRDDAKTKYQGVINSLAHYFYDRARQDNDQFLFGSYKTKTNIRPLDEGSDVDVLFKIDEDTYQRYENNPSGLLQEIRNALKETYSTTETIKAWGKVVLVKFSNGHHNVELLPARENPDGTFKIPNTENGGIWENKFDPRGQVDDFYLSKNHELVRDIVQMSKCWIRNTATMSYKSFKLMEDAIDFVNSYYPNGKCDNDYDNIMLDFFTILNNKKEYTIHLSAIDSYINSAHSRAVKAIEYRNNGKYIEATQEWQKIYGSMFKIATENDTTKNQQTRSFNEAASPWSMK